MCVWEGSCVKLKQKSILPVDISHDRTPTTRLEKEVGGFLEYPHPSQPQHNTLRAQPRWIKIHASQHPASKNRFRSEEWWWRCCKTVGRGKFCEMWLWNVCEDCSYHHTLGGDDPSLRAPVCYSDQPGGVKEGGGVAPDQSASVIMCLGTLVFQKKMATEKTGNHKWHKCGCNDKGIETSVLHLNIYMDQEEQINFAQIFSSSTL